MTDTPRHSRTWSFYDPRTGLFSGRTFAGSNEGLPLNTPRGMAAIAGRYDEFSQRVNVETGEVVDYQPAQPDDDHEWNADRKRWRLRPDVSEKRRKARQAQARIDELEQKQKRPHRELVLDPGNAEAKRRLQAIDAQIAELRGAL